MQLLLLASEHLHDGLPDLLVDADVEDGVDETVEVHEGDNLLEGWAIVLAKDEALTLHEDDRVGPDTDQEGQGDGAHDDGHSSLTSKQKIFPNFNKKSPGSPFPA